MKYSKYGLLCVLVLGLIIGNKLDIKAEENEKIFNVQDYGAIPNDGIDDTNILSMVLYHAYEYSGHSVVYIPSGVYDISVSKGDTAALNVRSDTDLIMESDTVLRMSGNSLSEFYLLSVARSKNVRITGGQLVGDRELHTSSLGECGHVIFLDDAENVTISDVTICNGWGDGIYIGSYTAPYVGSKQITVENCHIYNNRRNNISIVNGHDVTFRDCMIENANGTAPQAGVCIEPWYDSKKQQFDWRCKNLFFENCIFNTVSSDYEHFAFMTTKGHTRNAISSENVQIKGCTINGILGNYSAIDLWLQDTQINGAFDTEQDCYLTNTTFRTLIENPGVTIKVVDASFKDISKCEGYSLTIDGKIGINCYMSFSEVDEDGYVHLINYDGSEEDVKLCEARMTETGNYVFTLEVPASAMALPISLQYVIPAKDGQAERRETLYRYSVKEYAQYVLKNQSRFDAKLVDLVKAMLNYGGYAQLYFESNLNDVANQNVINQNSLYTANNDPVKKVLQQKNSPLIFEQMDENLQFYGASLVCKSSTDMRFYFKWKQGVELSEFENNYSVIIYNQNNSRKTATTVENGMIVVVVYDIAPAELGDDFKVSILSKQDGKTLEFCYSPMRYIVQAQNSKNQKLVYLTRAMYYYQQAAKNYFK